MNIELQSPHEKFNMLYGYTTQEETTLILHYHDAIFKNATVLDDRQKPLFLIEGSPSWCWRRKVFNAAGELFFKFCHESFDMKNQWRVEDPNDRRLCSLVHEKQITTDQSAINATVHTITDEDILVLMQPHSKGSAWTNIIVGGITVAQIRNFVDNAKTMGFKYNNNDQSTWEIHVAAEVDLSIIVVLALSRAEMAHDWKQ
ncbi:hypothetical protein F5Y09DRAFT_340887 [Xylaria sp. FL1042]|nr:hypothetical protein F5Y09DRAFT_340887 [Xylaria sp. FL1042]